MKLQKLREKIKSAERGGMVCIRLKDKEPLYIGAGIALFLAEIPDDGVSLTDLRGHLPWSSQSDIGEFTRREWLLEKLLPMGLVGETEIASRTYRRTETANQGDYRLRSIAFYSMKS